MRTEILFFIVFVIFMNFVSASPITLNSISIQSSPSACYNQPYVINVSAYDLNNMTISNLDYITVSFIPNNITFSEQNASYIQQGYYSIPVFIYNSSQQNYTAVVTAYQSIRQVSQNISFEVNNCTDSGITFSSFDNFFSDNWLIIVEFLVVFILFLFVIYIIVSLRKKS